MSASERLRMEARDVWSEDELEYPEVRYAASFWHRHRCDNAVAATAPSTRRGRARRDAVTPSPRHRHRDAVTRRSPRNAASSGAARKRSGGRSSRL